MILTTNVFLQVISHPEQQRTYSKEESLLSREQNQMFRRRTH